MLYVFFSYIFSIFFLPKERPGQIGIPNPKKHPQRSHNPEITTKIWLAPFQRNGSNDSMESSSNYGIPTLHDLLKTRPKTACVMENSSESITQSNHEILVNLLNVLETRRLRKSAYSPRWDNYVFLCTLSSVPFEKKGKELLIVFTFLYPFSNISPFCYPLFC